MRRLNDLAKIVDGTASHDHELEICGVGRVTCVSESEITFVTSKKHYEYFLKSPAAAALVSGIEGLTDQAQPLSPVPPKPIIIVENAEAAFTKVAKLFRPPVDRSKTTGIHPRATVSPTAVIGKDVTIGPGAVVLDGSVIGDSTVIFPNVTVMENCQIGAGVRIFPNTVLYEHTVVGDRVIIHAGVVLGAYGFGYKTSSGKHQLSAQLGNVVIEDDVELGANTTIDRGTFDATRIGRGTKLDNLVMIGHNCDIGQDTLLCSQVGVAGSCQVGNGVIMGGQVGVGDHLNIGDGSRVMAKSGLMHDVEPGQAVNGIPARNARKQMQMLAVMGKLPEMRRSIKTISAAIKELQERISPPQSDDRDMRDAA